MSPPPGVGSTWGGSAAGKTPMDPWKTQSDLSLDLLDLIRCRSEVRRAWLRYEAPGKVFLTCFPAPRRTCACLTLRSLAHRANPPWRYQVLVRGISGAGPRLLSSYPVKDLVESPASNSNHPPSHSLAHQAQTRPFSHSLALPQMRTSIPSRL